MEVSAAEKGMLFSLVCVFSFVLSSSFLPFSCLFSPWNHQTSSLYRNSTFKFQSYLESDSHTFVCCVTLVNEDRTRY